MQISCSHSGRFQVLNHLEYLLDLFLTGHDVSAKGQVIFNGCNVSSQISGIVKASDQMLSNLFFFIAEVPQLDLANQPFVKSGTPTVGNLTILIVLAFIGDAIFIIRCFVVIYIIREIEFFFSVSIVIELIVILIIGICLLLTLSAFIQGRITFQFFFDPLFQCNSGQLQELH